MQLTQEYRFEGKHLTASQAASQPAVRPARTWTCPSGCAVLPIGSLNLEIAADRSFTAEEMAFINSVIDQAAVAIGECAPAG